MGHYLQNFVDGLVAFVNLLLIAGDLPLQLCLSTVNKIFYLFILVLVD